MKIVTLPWPDKKLSPNAREHWAVKARLKKSARATAAKAAQAAGVRRSDASCLSVTAVFFPPDRRARDLDNMLASLKPSFDGIADVIGVDDSKWEIALRRDEPQKNGLVQILIGEVA